ncbi:MAG: sigma-70 family RNA polymerase sigma factor, partial [Pseudomonadota bacterium]
RSRAVAEELVQDSWLCWDKKNYPADKAFPIIRRIVSNLALDWARSRQTEKQVLQDLYATRDVDLDAERVLIARQDLAVVIATLKTMPKRTIAAFHMRFVEELTFNEIGQQLGLSLSRAHALIEDALVTITLALSD